MESLLHVSPEVKRVVWSKVALFQCFNTFFLPGKILFYSRELLKKAKSCGVKGNEAKMQIYRVGSGILPEDKTYGPAFASEAFVIVYTSSPCLTGARIGDTKPQLF